MARRVMAELLRMALMSALGFSCCWHVALSVVSRRILFAFLLVDLCGFAVVTSFIPTAFIVATTI